MKKKWFVSVLFLLIIAGFLFLLGNLQPRVNNSGEEVGGSETDSNVESEGKKVEITNAEKIEVIHFHATQQCRLCITLGEYALKAIEQEFPEEYESGIITFQKINVELAENKEIVERYQARESSFFVNAIVDGEDNIKEDVRVWRLLSSQKSFIEYFADKLSLMLGK